MDDEQIDVPNIPTGESPRVSGALTEEEPIITAPTGTFIVKPALQQSPKTPSPAISPVHSTPPLPFTSSLTKGSFDTSIRSQRSIKKDPSHDIQIENTGSNGSDSLNKLENREKQSSIDEQIKGRNTSMNGSNSMSIKSQKSNNKENIVDKHIENKSSRDTNESSNINKINGKDRDKLPLDRHSKEEDLDIKHDGGQSPVLYTNIDKIANMSKHLTNEANALRQSIKSLSENIVRTKKELSISNEENVNFPYHLFLIELIINQIHMKCDCFEFSYNNLVISASFLGKQPIVLYDSSYGKIDDFRHLNVGKSALFAMTYDKICSIKDFLINFNLTKQPPCSNCVMRVADAKIDCTKEFLSLRDDMCKKWTEEQPKDNIMCTTSTPLNKNMCYLRNGDSEGCDSIGMMEITVRMSFLGKEITTAFSASSKSKCTSALTKEDNGMSMYTCHDVEMDGQGKILLDENTLTRRDVPNSTHNSPSRRTGSPMSQISSGRGSTKQYLNPNNSMYPYHQDFGTKYNEIFTKMNENELRIRVPKTTKLDRMGRYDKIQELCSCENTPYNTGDQIQFELPRDNVYSNEYAHETNTSHLKYTYKGCDKSCDNKNRKVINVTPSNCPVPVNMEKQMHPRKDIFILRIGKKIETKDKKTDLEIELVTPKAPSDKLIENNNISQQCSCNDIKDKSAKKQKKNEKNKGKKSKTNIAKKKGKTQKKKKQ